MAITNSRFFWHTLFIIFLIFYAAVLIAQLGHGLASLDAHAIVRVTLKLLNQHEIEVSRPPGHPTTEVYLYPAVAWVLRHIFHTEFNEQKFLVLQGVAGITGLCIFYSLLGRLGTPPWKSVLGAVCLGLSAQYFANTVDGEEFVLALLLLILSLRLLIVNPHSAPGLGRMIAALVCFGLATGCRPEAVFAGFIYPLYALFHPKWGSRQAIVIILAEALIVIAVWLPILLVGLHSPYTSGMDIRESILGGCYRLVFQCFTLPVFALLCWVLLASVLDWRRQTSEQFPNNFVFAVSCITPLVFFAALFLHASKPAHVIFAIPFVLLLVVQRSSELLIVWTVATIVGCLFTVDIFKERRLVGPRPVAGSYFQAVRQKPFYRIEYLQKILQQCGGSRTAVIGDLWRWDLEYHIAHGTLSAREEKLEVPGVTLPMFVLQEHTDCVLLPRDGALDPKLIQSLSLQGYAVRMDATLYRTLFARYDVTAPTPAKGQIGTIPVELFSTTQH